MNRDASSNLGSAAVSPAGGIPTDFPLHDAIRARDIESVRQLIASGVDINAIEPHGGSPLFLAMHESQPEAAELIRKAGGRLVLAGSVRAVAIFHTVMAGVALLGLLIWQPWTGSGVVPIVGGLFLLGIVCSAAYHAYIGLQGKPHMSNYG